MSDRDLIAEGRRLLAALADCPATDRVFDVAEWAVPNLPALLDALESAREAIEVVQTAHESQLTRMAKERAKAERKIARLQAELEAAQRPPLGYVAGRHSADGWGFARFYGGPDEIRAGAEHDLANALEEDGPDAGWQLLEIREAQP
jgi:hypothetical protein